MTITHTRYIARRNVIIVSGLALEIDAIAHKAALIANGATPATRAVDIFEVIAPSMTNEAAQQSLLLLASTHL